MATVVKRGTAGSALAKKLREHGLLPERTVSFSIAVPDARGPVRITAEYLVPPGALETALDLHLGIQDTH